MTRHLLVVALFALALIPVLASATPAVAPKGPFTVPTLPYSFNALEPVIDAKTMETHVTKHHQAYVDKLNGEVGKNSALQGKTIEQIVAHVSKYNAAVRNNAGGHWNHSFFWTLMAPADKSGEPSTELSEALTKSFGSVDAFKTAFEKAGTDRFGSGWAWLILNKDGKLEVISTPNQDNPLMDDAPVKGIPVLANDVWEHAYYLTYQNKRADYLKSWWKVVNWDQVSKNYAEAVSKK